MEIYKDLLKIIKILEKFIKIHRNSTELIEIYQKSLTIHENFIELYKNSSKLMKIPQISEKFIEICNNSCINCLWDCIPETRNHRNYYSIIIIQLLFNYFCWFCCV